MVLLLLAAGCWCWRCCWCCWWRRRRQQQQHHVPCESELALLDTARRNALGVTAAEPAIAAAAPLRLRGRPSTDALLLEFVAEQVDQQRLIELPFSGDPKLNFAKFRNSNNERECFQHTLWPRSWKQRVVMSLVLAPSGTCLEVHAAYWLLMIGRFSLIEFTPIMKRGVNWIYTVATPP